MYVGFLVKCVFVSLPHPKFGQEESMSSLLLTKTYIPDDTENDLCIASNDPPVFWGLWRGEV